MTHSTCARRHQGQATGRRIRHVGADGRYSTNDFLDKKVDAARASAAGCSCAGCHGQAGRHGRTWTGKRSTTAYSADGALDQAGKNPHHVPITTRAGTSATRRLLAARGLRRAVVQGDLHHRLWGIQRRDTERSGLHAYDPSPPRRTSGSPVHAGVPVRVARRLGLLK